MRDFCMKTIFLGSYWQSNDQEKEPIEWIVLKEDDDKMYVISKYCLDCVPYCDDGKIAWKNSLMRKWLNDYFLNNAFSLDEQDKIILSNIRTKNGNIYLLDEGAAVQDKVFLPSEAEVNIFFSYDGTHKLLLQQKRIARPTNYALSQGCWAHPLEYGPIKDSCWKDSLLRDSVLTGGFINPNESYWQISAYPLEKEGSCRKDTVKKRWAASWYLRSSGNEIIYVEPDGSLGYTEKRFVNIGETNKHTAARPAMWIKK